MQNTNHFNLIECQNVLPCLKSSTERKAGTVKWFKHMCDFRTEEAASVLIDEMGYAGLGMWWVLIEVLGGKLTKANRTTKYSATLKGWRKLTGIYPRTFEKLIRLLDRLGLIKLTIITPSSVEGEMLRQEIYEIDAPILLEWLDETTRKSGTRQAQELESESESESKIESNSISKEMKDDVPEDVFGKLILPDGTTIIISNKKVEEYDRMFPNVSAALEIDSLIRWTQQQTKTGGWTNKQRSEWTAENIASKLYSILKYKQNENSGKLADRAAGHSSQGIVTKHLDSNSPNSMPSSWMYWDNAKRDEYVAKHGKVRPYRK